MCVYICVSDSRGQKNYCEKYLWRKKKFFSRQIFETILSYSRYSVHTATCMYLVVYYKNKKKLGKICWGKKYFFLDKYYIFFRLQFQYLNVATILKDTCMYLLVYIAKTREKKKNCWGKKYFFLDKYYKFILRLTNFGTCMWFRHCVLVVG